MDLVPSEVALVKSEKILVNLPWHCMPATLSWNQFLNLLKTRPIYPSDMIRLEILPPLYLFLSVCFSVFFSFSLFTIVPSHFFRSTWAAVCFRLRQAFFSAFEEKLRAPTKLSLLTKLSSKNPKTQFQSQKTAHIPIFTTKK